MNKAISLLVVAMLATGCASEMPIPTTHPVSSQQKLKSAHHWDVIARDTAQQAVAGLAKANLAGMPVSISTQQPDTPFQAGFRNFLLTRLVVEGQPVVQSGADVEVTFEAQVVRHPTMGSATPPGKYTALAAGIAVLRQVSRWDDSSLIVGGLGLTALADLGSGYYTPLSKTEVIVTTSVLRAGKYIVRKTDVYYVDDADGLLYEKMKMQMMKEWRVVG
jgi:hypothetical protein